MTIVDRQFLGNRLALFTKAAFAGLDLTVSGAAGGAERAGKPRQIVDLQITAKPLPQQQDSETSHG